MANEITIVSKHTSNGGSYWATLSQSGQTGESSNTIVIEFTTPNISGIKQLSLNYVAQQPGNNDKISGSIYFYISSTNPYSTTATKASASNNHGSVSWSGGTWHNKKTWPVTLNYSAGLSANTTYYIVVNSSSILDYFVSGTSLSYVTPTYTITYTAGTNGSGSNQTQTTSHIAAIKIKGAIFTRTGYTQRGWSTSDGGPKVYELSQSFADGYGFSRDVTLYPYWEINIHTDSYDYNGGDSGGGTFTGAYGSSYTMPSASKAGYTFNGWYTSITGGTRVGGAGDDTTHDDTSNYYYAHWTANKYEITYNGNGGYYLEEETWSEEVTYDSLYALWSNNNFFVRPGYKFLGWNTSPTGKPGDTGDWTKWTRPDGVSTENLNSDTQGVWTWKYDHDNTVVYAMWEALATIHTKVGNDWKAGAPYTKVGNTWKKGIAVYVKVDNKWKLSTR